MPACKRLSVIDMRCHAALVLRHTAGRYDATLRASSRMRRAASPRAVTARLADLDPVVQRDRPSDAGRWERDAAPVENAETLGIPLPRWRRLHSCAATELCRPARRDRRAVE